MDVGTAKKETAATTISMEETVQGGGDQDGERRMGPGPRTERGESRAETIFEFLGLREGKKVDFAIFFFEKNLSPPKKTPWVII